MNTSLRLLMAFVITVQLFSALRVPSDIKAEMHVRSRVVKLTSVTGSCSGVQVRSPKGLDYILTASHCNSLAVNGSILASLDGERPIPRRIIEDADFTDLMLLEGMPNLEGIRIAKRVDARQHIMAITHGLGLATHRSDGEAMESKEIAVALDLANSEAEQAACVAKPKSKIVPSFFGMICALVVHEMITTVRVEPGSSGGPVVDMNGHLVGIVSIGNESISGLALLSDIHKLMSAY